MPHLDERLLDDPAELTRLDSRDYLRALATAGAQVRQAVTLTEEAGLDRLRSEGRPRVVLVCALGSSGVVGDALAALAEDHGPVPVSRRVQGRLPA